MVSNFKALTRMPLYKGETDPVDEYHKAEDKV